MLYENGAGLHAISSNPDSDNIFSHIVLRTPLLTKNSWRIISKFCQQEFVNAKQTTERMAHSSQLLIKLSKRSGVNNFEHIAEICTKLATQDFADDLTRHHLINEMTKIYQNGSNKLRIIIENKCIEHWLRFLKEETPPPKFIPSEEQL